MRASGQETQWQDLNARLSKGLFCAPFISVSDLSGCWRQDKLTFVFQRLSAKRFVRLWSSKRGGGA